MAPPSQITWVTDPAEHRDAVVIPCDAMALPFALFLAHQIDRQETGRRFDVVVAVSDRAALPAGHDPEGVKLIEIGRNKRIESLPHTRSITFASYYWIALTAALAETYRRVLFLDADIYLNRPGLAGVFGDAPLPHAVAAAPAGTEYHDRGDGLTYFHERENLPGSHIYRNGGVELVDIDRAMTENIPDRLIDFRRKLGRKVSSTDQTAMNVVLHEDLALLSPSWNFLTLPASLGLVDRFDPVLIHFADNPKPWVEVEGFPSWSYHAEYAEFLDRVFGAEDLLRRGVWGRFPPLRHPGNPFAAWRHRRAARAKAEKNRNRRAELEARPRCNPEVIARFYAEADI